MPIAVTAEQRLLWRVSRLRTFRLNHRACMLHMPDQDGQVVYSSYTEAGMKRRDQQQLLD